MQQINTNVIVICGNEPELVKLAEKLNQLYCNGRAAVYLYNQIHNIALVQIDQLFLVGHANINTIGEYTAQEYCQGTWADILKRSQKIYLAGCSTINEAQQLVKKIGFYPSTIGKIIKDNYPEAEVLATPGTLVLISYSDGTSKLKIEINRATLSQGASNEDEIWTKVSK
jgi:hypothetical protein